MAAKPRASGNYVSEWFGQRIYPTVRIDAANLADDRAGNCPFLSDVQRRSTACVKSANSAGVCSVSSSSNGSRQDWLVCPYRVISSDIVSRGCQVIFGLADAVAPLPVSILAQPAELKRFTETVAARGSGYLFFQDKLGGEISVLGTPRSPELSFDVTLVEITADGQGGFVAARFGILEIQTMDYHGTYKHAVSNLRDGLRLHPLTFPATLAANLERWAGDHVEGPNIANVFKRTFYQMLVKFKLAGDGSAAAGTVLALPRSVWDSWQPFLGAPELEDEAPGIKRLRRQGKQKPTATPLNAFICVFDLDASVSAPISPVRIEHFIRVSPEQLANHAFTEVPDTILHAIRSDESVLARIRVRLGQWWPAFGVKTARTPAKRPTTRRQ